MFKKIASIILVVVLVVNALALVLPSNSVEAKSITSNSSDNGFIPNTASAPPSGSSSATVSAPYKSVNGSTWENELALGWANAGYNYNTGYIAASSFSYAGGASARAAQFIDVNIPSGQLSEVTVVASIVYVGGCQKFGISGSSWGGVDKVWFIGNDQYREEIDPAFGWDDIATAAVDIALTLAPGVVELSGIEKTSKIARLVETIGNVNDAYSIASGFTDLLTAGDAERTTISFSFEADNNTQVGVGLRTDTSGCILGACDTTVLGYVEYFYVSVSPVWANGYWSFNSWDDDGIIPDFINDDSGSQNYAAAVNGVTSIASSRYSKGIKLDGVNDYVELGFDSSERAVLTSQGTIEMWVKPEQCADALLFWAGSGDDADGWGPETELHLSTDSFGRFNFSLSSLSVNEFYKSVSFGSYTVNNWYHVAVTYRNILDGEICCYVNGQKVQPSASACPYNTRRAYLTVDNIRLGKAMTDDRLFKGEMDEVKVYSRILDDSQIRFECWQYVDVTAPPVPAMIAEPQFTSTNANKVACSPVTDSEIGVWQYCFECSDGNTTVQNWTSYPNYTFTGLTDGTLYTYRVKVKDFSGNVSGWSSAVSSTQDNSPPVVGSINTSNIVSGQVQNDQIVFTLPLSASDSNGIAAIQVFSPVSYMIDFTQPYPSSISSVQFNIPLVFGPAFSTSTGRQLCGCFIDVCGNVRNFNIPDLKIDYQNPSGSISLKYGLGFTGDQSIPASLSYSHLGLTGTVTQMRFSNDNAVWSNWEAVSTSKPSWQLSDGYGLKTVYVQFKDACGHVSSSYSDTILYEQAPSGDIIIDNNNYWAASRNVTLSLNSATAAQMSIWDGTSQSGWITYQSTYNWILSSAQGTKTVSVRYKSAAGQESSVYSDTIVLDTVHPSGTVTINSDENVTSSESVTLTIASGHADVEMMRLCGDDEVWMPWQPFQTTCDLLLSSVEGSKLVGIQFMDQAGNISDISYDSIFLDKCAPVGLLEINSGDKFTGSTAVSVNAVVTGQEYSLPEQFSSSQGSMGWYYYQSPCIGEYYELVWDDSVAPEKDPMGYYAWNSADELSSDYLQITGPDQGLILQPGEGDTGNVAVVWATGDKSREISIEAEIWSALPDSPQSDSDDDGVKFYLLKNNEILVDPVEVFHDSTNSYGLLETKGITMTPGDVIVFYIERQSSSLNDQVHYHFTITDSEETKPVSVRIANLDSEKVEEKQGDNNILWWTGIQDVTWTDWYPLDEYMEYSDPAWLLPAGDGTKTVICQFMDSVGNISHPFKSSIILDQTPPESCSISVNAGVKSNSDPNVDLSISGLDYLSGVTKMMISVNGSVGTWEPYAKQKNWTVSEAGENTFTVSFIDAVGNISVPCSAAMLYNPMFADTPQRFGQNKWVEMADVNGDSYNDLVMVSSRGSGVVGLCLNQGDGTFMRTSNALLLLSNARKPLIADLDNDGDLDMVIVPNITASGVPIKVLFNDGSGVFSENQSVTLLDYVSDCAIGDIDNDGMIDMIISGIQGMFPATILLENKNGIFMEAGHLVSGAVSIAIGDVDNDEIAEILLGQLQISQEQIKLYRIDQGNFQYVRTLPSTSVTASGGFPMVLFDFDGDKDLDLITGGDKTVAWTNNGSGYLSPSASVPFYDLASSRITPADIDNDGTIDLVIEDIENGYNRVNIGLSWGNLSAGEIYPVRYECYSNAAVGDVDGDNLVDIVLGCLIGSPSDYYIDMPSTLVLINQSSSNQPPSKPGNLQSSVNGSGVTLSWDTASDGVTPANDLTYNLEIGLSADGCEIFSGAIPPGFGNLGTRLSKHIHLDDGTYYWKVRTIDGAYSYSDWAEGDSFTIDTTAPSGYGCSTPANNSVLVPLIPSLVSRTAADANGPVEYFFQLAEDNAFTLGVQSSSWQKSTSWSPAALNENTVYYWRVKARDSFLNTSAYSASYSFTTTGSYTITATAGDNGSISPSGQVSVIYGGNQSFTITPDEGSDITDVLVDGDSVGPVSSYTFTNVLDNHTIEAGFAIKTYTVSFDLGDHGTLTGGDLVQTVNYGSDAAAPTFTVEEGWTFTGWDTAFIGVTSDLTVNAQYSINSYTITATAGDHGSIGLAGSLTVYTGMNVFYDINPDSGYRVSDVLVDGISVGAVSSYTFTNVLSDHTIYATFEPVPVNFTVTASAGAHGSISPLGDSTVSAGDNLSFSITPDSGYQVAGVLVDGVSVGAVSSYTFTDIQTNHTITASFEVSDSVVDTGVYSINIKAVQGGPGTIFPVSYTNPVTISGTIEADNFSGTYDQYKVRIFWGDGASVVIPCSELNLSVNGNKLKGSWVSPSHTYANGTYVITVVLYHGDWPGKSASEAQFQTMPIRITGN